MRELGDPWEGRRGEAVKGCGRARGPLGWEERGGGEQRARELGDPWEGRRGEAVKACGSWGAPGREPDWPSLADSTAGEGADFFLR